MQLCSDSSSLATQTIHKDGIWPAKTQRLSIASLATAITAGDTSLIGQGLYLPKNQVSMYEVLIACRKKGLEEETINRELFYALSLMIYKGSPNFWKGHSRDFNRRVFCLGLSLIRQFLGVRLVELRLLGFRGQNNPQHHF